MNADRLEAIDLQITILQERITALEDVVDRAKIAMILADQLRADVCATCGEPKERSGAAWMTATRIVEKCPGHMVTIGGAS